MKPIKDAQYVPLEKRSKKEQKAFYAQQRKSWGNVNPVTKKLPNGKAHHKKKARQWKNDDHGLAFYIFRRDYFPKFLLINSIRWATLAPDRRPSAGVLRQ